VSLLEILDRTTIDAVERAARVDLGGHNALVFVQVDDHSDADAVERVCRDRGADEVHGTTDQTESELLLHARRLALPALQQLGAVILDDMAVPRMKVPALIERVEAVAADAGLVIGTFGHAGDGNLHPTIVYDSSDDDQRRAAGSSARGSARRSATRPCGSTGRSRRRWTLTA
jgi:FAD/FMN-containing dehydrogenase